MSVENLRLFCSNVRGLVCNWSSATSFSWDDYDLVAFNEIWDVKEFENLKVDNFEVKTIKTRQVSRGGGTIIFGRSNISMKALNSPFVEGTIESTGVRVGSVNFINIYRPPSGSKDNFVEVLTQYLDTLRGQKIIIGGDFNLNAMGGNFWLNTICNLYGLEIKIDNITRIESQSCIDNYLTNTTGAFRVSNIAIADHQAIVANIQLAEKLVRKDIRFQYRQMKEDNWLCFKQGINSIEINGYDSNAQWNNLVEDVKRVVDFSFPVKFAKQKYIFTMSQGLLRSKDRKNKLLRQYKLGQIDKKIYIEYNKVYRKLIKTEQANKFKERLGQAGTNGKLKWKVIKQGLLLEPEKNKIEEICHNGIFHKDDESIAKAFKDHFETCATNLTRGLPEGNDTSVLMPLGESWKFEPTNEIEIRKIIAKMKNKNSSGFDGLSNRMLKREPHAFSRLLTPLINKSLEEGVFPDCLKTANVIPIHKKGDRANLNNYRPISLLPVLSKIFEKIINQQLNTVVEDKYIDENQFGFRVGFNTEDAVVKFIDRIEKDLSLGLHVVSVYVDVSKAFDSCDHQILLNKIKRTGLDDNGVKLIGSYLKNRTQMVIVNDKQGGTFIINIGVGQGTILGPTFFKIYIMDMHLCTSLFCVKFADDSSFEGSGKTRDEVQTKVNSELIKISEWFKNNKLKLHPDKSRFIIHSRDKLVRIYMSNSEVQRCGYGLQEEGVKLLGITIDENLDWKLHINGVIKKISKGNYLFWRYKKQLNKATKKTIYESFVRCHLLYGLVAWGGAKNLVLQPLLKTLNKIYRKFGRRLMHTSDRLKESSILKFKDELAIQESKFLWRWEKNKLPHSLRDIVTERRDRLRGRRFDISRRLKNESINKRLTKRANDCITTIAIHKSKQTLASKLKKHSLDQYNTNCINVNCYICSNA